MTYEQIIQSVGKTIDKLVYYYVGDQRTDLLEDDFLNAKIKYNANLTGTIMKGLEIELTKKVPANATVYLEITASIGTNSATKTYGPYNIKETKYNADTQSYSHICYDDILKTMIEYEPLEIEYPTSVGNYFYALLGRLGLTTNVLLVNESNILENDIYEGIGFTYRDVLDDIAKANGELFYIDGTYLLRAELGDDGVVINDDILMNKNIEFGDVVGPINVITISRSADTDSIYYPEELPDKVHEYKISDCQMLNGDNRGDYIEGIYERLNGITYSVFDCELTGWGGFDPLQKVQFQTGETVYNSYIFNNEIEIDQGYKEVIYTELPEETTTNYLLTSSDDRKLKEASIIIDKKIGAVDIRGKEINLTGDEISITSNNFSVTKEGRITATSGKIGGFDMDDIQFEYEINPGYEYNDSDITRIRNITSGSITPTQQDYEKYDVDGNGVIDLKDFVHINQFIKTNISSVTPGYFKIKHSEESRKIYQNELGFYDGNGDMYTGMDFGHIKVAGHDLNWEHSQILLTTGAYMTDTQTYTFQEPVSAQPHGIVLVWSAYQSGVQDYQWHFDYIPKVWVANHGSNGVSCIMSGAKLYPFCSKYVYISDTQIKGHADNKFNGTNANGIKLQNDLYVLRYVIGV